MFRIYWTGVFSLLFCAVLSGSDNENTAAKGYQALTTKALVPPIWLRTAYDSAWKRWGVKTKPADYDATFQQRYGLHPAPYANNGLPMGLKETSLALGMGKSITLDCMICHGGSIGGKSYIGLGNTSLDLDSIFTELSGLGKDGTKTVLFPFTNVRGTTEAAAMSVFLFSIRNEDLSLRATPHDFKLRADLCEDTPPWWHLKKKKTLYYNGSVDSRSVRTLMQFSMSPLYSKKAIAAQEKDFQNIQAYLKTIEPPKYPFAIDETKAERGERIFAQNCSHCHGTYGKNPTYPNKLIPLDEIGTDPNRANGVSDAAKVHYDKTWFAEETDAEGNRLKTSNARVYQAPPLDGIWATAPYLHNGSVPTLYDLLNSKNRPTRYTRSYKTDFSEYDTTKIGWKTTEAKPAGGKSAYLDRFIYDTELPGRKNKGHIYGDELTEEERSDLIEYLKKL